MTKQEIKNKFDEIVDFAGVERYIDTPVKRYSSGMYVRLAFGVAAHLEPEILIVDEVLAVGDAEFQKKALGKMKDVSQGQGRTVLFVSHNMAAVSNLCTSGLVLANGGVSFSGCIDDAINHYQLTNKSTASELNDFNRTGTGLCRIRYVKILTDKKETDVLKLGDTISIEISLENLSKKELNNIRIIIGVYNSNEEGFLRFDTNATNGHVTISESGSKIICKINEHLNIKPDHYSMNIAILNGEEMVDYVSGVAKFAIENFDYYQTGQSIADPQLSKVFYKHDWLIITNNQS